MWRLFVIMASVVVSVLGLMRQRIGTMASDRGMETKEAMNHLGKMRRRLDSLGKLVQEGEAFVVPADSVSIGRGLGKFESAESVALTLHDDIGEMAGESTDESELAEAAGKLRHIRDLLAAAKKDVRADRKDNARRQLLVARQDFHELYAVLRRVLWPGDGGGGEQGDNSGPDTGNDDDGTEPWHLWRDDGVGD